MGRLRKQAARLAFQKYPLLQYTHDDAPVQKLQFATQAEMNMIYFFYSALII